MKKHVVLYSMVGCPYCDMLKDSLNESNIEYTERDINEHEYEYDQFKLVNDNNEFIPAVLIFEENEGKVINPRGFVPDRDFDDISELYDIIVDNVN